jgi:hypothetical protein
VIDLGSSPISNAYLGFEQLAAPEAVFPLKVLVCTQCWLVQTEDFVGAETMFTADYAYFSSYSDSWLEHAKTYVHAMIQRFHLGPLDTVVEVAANDGYLLQFVRDARIPCYGIEPTHGTAVVARERGIDIVEEFFGVECATRLAREDRPKLMIANNVLAHVPDINDFVSGFTTLLAPDGLATFEFPYLVNLIDFNQFDTIYHEHYSYLSLSSVVAIFATNGLTVFEVEQIPTHGGSLRVFAQRADAGSQPIRPSVRRLLQAEQAAGVSTEAFYKQLQPNARRIADELVWFLRDAKARGATVAAYGAAAKGNTMLNYAGVSKELIEFVVDRNPAKQGKFLPASHIPVVSEDQLRAAQPDYVLILPWNLESEIRNQLSYAAAWGAQFVTAVPHLSIVG